MPSANLNSLLTVAVIARDEEKNLPVLFDSLRGLPSSTQLIVVDTGSRDNTKSLSKSLGAEVHDFVWQDDFSAARNFALSLSLGHWILWLDADDALPMATLTWIKENLDLLDPEKAYAFHIRSPGPDGTQFRFYQIRLFPNHRGIQFQNAVHETIGDSIQEKGMSVLACGMDIVHHGYSELLVIDRKRKRNSALLQKAMTSDSNKDTQPSATLRLAWGKMLMSEGRWHEAEIALASIFKFVKNLNSEVELATRICLGQSLGFLYRHQDALAVFERRASFDPIASFKPKSPNAQFYLEYGKALWLAGQLGPARKAWMNCLTAGQEIGAIPTDWDTVLDGARQLLDATAPKLPPILKRQPSRPNETKPKQQGDSRWLNLSVCSIFKDEAENLPGLIQSLPLSRIEWVVLDTGSKDATVDILRKVGVEPHRFQWIDDFSAARNESLRHAQRDWILWLDGDDRLDEEFWEGLIPLLEGAKQAYRFIIRSPRENSHGERFRQIRLFPNHFGITFEGRIHEQLGTCLQRLGIKAAQEDLEIVHIGYNTESKRKAKLQRNRNLLEKEILEYPKDSTVALEYGNCLFQSGEFLEAKKVYLSFMPNPDPGACQQPPRDEVLDHFPSLLAETCLRLNQDSEAYEWYRLATLWNSGDIYPFYWLGKKALEEKNIPGALELFYATLDRPALVGRLATDSFTVRRNALALTFLCEIQLFGTKNAPRAKKCLQELIEGGLNPFPLEYRVPWDFLLEIKAFSEAERYARTYLGLFPSDLVMWENFLEFLFTTGRHGDVQAIFAARPDLILATGILEAFRGKALEASKEDPSKIYDVYRQALEKFPEDPTLLVYFSDFVNHNQLFERCYVDLKALPRSSEPVLDFLRQLEANGLGGEGKS
jgi:glycosyltransferase involved in cell wall biosynthesis